MTKNSTKPDLEGQAKITPKQLLEIINRPEILSSRKKPVVANDLSIWQTRGAIPRPERHGRGRGKGATFLYPAYTVEQIKDLIALLEEKRSLDWAMLRLWIEGYYPVDYKPILRKALVVYRKWRDGLRAIDKNGRVILSDKIISELKYRYNLPDDTQSVARRSKSARLYNERIVILSMIANTSEPIPEEIMCPEPNFSIEYPSSLFGVKRWISEVEQLFFEVCTWLDPDFIERFLDVAPYETLRSIYILVSPVFRILSEFPPIKTALKNFPVYQSRYTALSIPVLFQTIHALEEGGWL